VICFCDVHMKMSELKIPLTFAIRGQNVEHVTTELGIHSCFYSIVAFTLTETLMAQVSYPVSSFLLYQSILAVLVAHGAFKEFIHSCHGSIRQHYSGEVLPSQC
jgi:hypothetical protein